MRASLPVLIAVLLWASAFACSKLAVGEVPHEVAALLRFGGGALVLLVVLRLLAPREDPVPRRRLGAIAVLGVLGVFLYNLLLFGGLTLAPSVDGSVIVPVLSPVITAAATAVLERRWPSRSRLVGLLLAVAGAAVFLAGAAGGPASGSRLLGDLSFVLAAGVWAAYTIRGKAVLALVSPLRVTTYATVAGALLLGLVAVPALLRTDWTGLGAGFWLNQVYLAVLPTALANPLFYYGVRRIGPVRATTLMFVVPGAGLLWSALLLGESINALQLAGTLVMLAGAWLALGLRPLPRRFLPPVRSALR
ncbi:DMT family transporter [Amycolatopsis nigrescens]|uniref:DMT family transporter n=1 Tax=Amycolatopsis nigrescens TaxID=381445 RepID=UPI00036AC800|nr:DMT family transporter [Amycolatopsis nigrescens]